MRRGLDRGRETIFSGRPAKYHDVSHIYPQAPRIRAANYYINCKVGQACFSPKHGSRCFPQSGGVRVPRPAPETATSPWENVKFKEKHHAKTPILVKACLYTAKDVKFQSLTASLSPMAGPRSEKLEKSSRLRMRWKSFCERWPQGSGATVEKSIYIYTYIYISISRRSPQLLTPALAKWLAKPLLMKSDHSRR